MNYLNEQNIMIFLLQVILLLGLSRIFGEVFRRFKQPAITAEILVGIILGPTLLGRWQPALSSLLFPADITQQNMLETVAWIGILFFLLKTGLEMDLSQTWRQRGQALTIAFIDVVIPMVIAFIPTFFFVAKYFADPQQRIIFSLFIATVSTISALPITARVLQDLKLFKTDVGFLIMGALSLNDIIGWAVFTLILGVATSGEFHIFSVLGILAATAGFTVFCLTVGRVITQAVIVRFQRYRVPEPAASLTFICLLGMLCGALTVHIGIHALFGFFIAGIMAGEAPALSQKTRTIIGQMVHALFVPLFFASIGLKIDFMHNFNLPLVLFITLLGTAGRYAGAWLGVTLTRHPRVNRTLISIAHTPGGEMQIVVGILALEHGLIAEPVFVAIVFGALFSSVTLGPWMAWALGKRKSVAALEFFQKEAIVPAVSAADKESAIRELILAITEQLTAIDEEALVREVIGREGNVSTALEDGVAIPHARMAGISRPIIAVGRSVGGVEWNSPDGKLTTLIFLIITGVDDDWTQLQILRAIALVMQHEHARVALMSAHTRDEIWGLVRGFFAPQYICNAPNVDCAVSGKGDCC